MKVSVTQKNTTSLEGRKIMKYRNGRVYLEYFEGP